MACMDEPQGDGDLKQRERPDTSGPLRVCCTCLLILGLLAGAGVGTMWVFYSRAYDPARAAQSLQEILPLDPPPGYQASFHWRWSGLETVLMGPAGVDLRTPQGQGLRMMFGVLAVPPANDGERVQRQLVEWLQTNERFKLRVDETRTIPVTVRGQDTTATEVLGTVLEGGARCRLVTVIVPRDPAAPEGAQVLVGGLGEREGFDQAAWEALLRSIR